LRLVVLLAVVLIGAPLGFFFWFAPPREQLPIEAFLPERLAGGVRLTGLQQAWARHWLQRAAHMPPGMPAPTADDALMRILDALDKWPDWVKKYGEQGALLRLGLYQKTLFQALGQDAWIIFGDWGGAPPASKVDDKPRTSATLQAEPPMGLVVLLRGDGPLKSRIGPLMELAFADYKVERTSHGGVPIYEYKDKRLGRSVSFCQMGGWIVASWRQQGAGPLPLIIDQARGWQGQSAAARPQHAQLRPLLTDGLTSGALRAVFYPDVFWGEYRQFAMQRNKGISRESEDLLKYWQQRLDGVERVTLRQSGESLFDWTLALNGPAAGRWYTQWQQEAHSTTTLGNDAPLTKTLAGTTLAAGNQRSELLQLDLDLPFARLALPLAGYAWEDVLEPATMLDLVAPGLRAQLLQRLTAWAQPAGGRLGFAGYVGASPFIPDILGWIDMPPRRAESAAPARLWRELEQNRALVDANDQLFWVKLPLGVGMGGANLPTTTTTSAGWGGLLDEFWNTPPTPPPGFIAINFREVASGLERIPPVLLKKKEQKKLRRWRRTTEGLSLGLGAAALRVDGTPEEWRLVLHTL
jgi:hypothetical protein